MIEAVSTGLHETDHRLAGIVDAGSGIGRCQRRTYQLGTGAKPGAGAITARIDINPVFPRHQPIAVGAQGYHRIGGTGTKRCYRTPGAGADTIAFGIRHAILDPDRQAVALAIDCRFGRCYRTGRIFHCCTAGCTPAGRCGVIAGKKQTLAGFGTGFLHPDHIGIAAGIDPHSWGHRGGNLGTHGRIVDRDIRFPDGTVKSGSAEDAAGTGRWLHACHDHSTPGVVDGADLVGHIAGTGGLLNLRGRTPGSGH